jgi:hypothetical protein
MISEFFINLSGNIYHFSPFRASFSMRVREACQFAGVVVFAEPGVVLCRRKRVRRQTATDLP